MKQLRSWLAYSFYVAVLGALFVYILFPAEAVSRYIVARVTAVDPEVRLAIGDVSPILPPGLKLKQVTVAHIDGDLLEVPEIRLYPRWFSLLGRQPSLAYTAVAGRGHVRGAATAAESSTGRQVRWDAELQGVRVEELGLPQPLAAYGLKGVVSGKIRYFRGKNRTAEIRMTVTDMTLAPPKPVLGIRQLQFENVRTEATLENRKLKLSRVTLTGQQINGELAGNVVLDRPLTDSTVSLGGMLQLNLRAQGSQTAPRPGDPDDISLTGKVPVRIQGTLGNPTVSLR